MPLLPLRLQIYRDSHATAYWIARVAYYYVIVMALTFLIGVSINLLLGSGVAPKILSHKATHRISIPSTLIWAPAIETMAMYLVWKFLQKLGFDKLRNAAFVIVIGALAFIAHGASILSLLPCAMFVVTSIYVVRSDDIYHIRPARIFFAVYVIHALYNTPYALRTLLQS